MRLSLNGRASRIEFARHLYNLLCVELNGNQDQATRFAIDELNRRIENLPLKSMYTGDVTCNNGRRRAPSGNSECAGGGGGDDQGQPLTAHGYEVVPAEVEDAHGGKWE